VVWGSVLDDSVCTFEMYYADLIEEPVPVDSCTSTGRSLPMCSAASAVHSAVSDECAAAAADSTGGGQCGVMCLFTTKGKPPASRVAKGYCKDMLTAKDVLCRLNGSAGI
jgi:hypothetical protein